MSEYRHIYFEAMVIQRGNVKLMLPFNARISDEDGVAVFSEDGDLVLTLPLALERIFRTTDDEVVQLDILRGAIILHYKALLEGFDNGEKYMKAQFRNLLGVPKAEA